MTKQFIFLQPVYPVIEKIGDSALFCYRRSEIATILLNQNKILSRYNPKKDSPNASILEVTVEGTNNPIIITPIKDNISKYGIEVNADNPKVKIHIAEMTSDGFNFSITYDNKLLPGSKTFQLGDEIDYQLNFKPK